MTIKKPPTGDSDLVNLEQLKQVIALEGDDYAKLMRMYMKDTQLQLRRMETAIQKKSAPDLRQSAHAALGASNMLGMRAIAFALRQLQDLADQSDLSRAPELLFQARQEVRRSQAFLAQVKKESLC